MIATRMQNAEQAEHAMSGHGTCRIYDLDEPYNAATHLAVVVYDGEGIGWQNKGVEVFACDEIGNVPVMDTVYQSYLIEPHTEVLARLGYEVTNETSTGTEGEPS